MKSVGEVMGIGRTFEEAYQKALRMLDLGFEGAIPADDFFASPEELTHYLTTPTPMRPFALAAALKAGTTLEDIYQETGIDPWFLQRINNILKAEQTSSARQRIDHRATLGTQATGHLGSAYCRSESTRRLECVRNASNWASYQQYCRSIRWARSSLPRPTIST